PHRWVSTSTAIGLALSLPGPSVDRNTPYPVHLPQPGQGAAVPQERSVTHPACMESLPALLDFAEAECKRLRADVSTAFAIKLAVEEACVNVIQHGYPPDAAGPIVLSIRADSSRFVVTLADRAVPFLPEDAPPPDLSA